MSMSTDNGCACVVLTTVVSSRVVSCWCWYWCQFVQSPLMIVCLFGVEFQCRSMECNQVDCSLYMLMYNTDADGDNMMTLSADEMMMLHAIWLAF